MKRIPVVYDNDGMLISTEKTLRDEFAMAVITGLLADSNVREEPDKLASAAYLVADAMMKARF